MVKIEMRLRKLERAGSEYGDIIKLVKDGAYYDELSERQQKEYCLYRYGLDHNPEEYLSYEVFGKSFDKHFKLELRPPKPTADELKKSIEDVERMVLDVKNENFE